MSEMYSFFSDNNAKEVFASIDYTLRTGKHIQRQYHGQADAFKFIRKHFEELRQYYIDFFGLSLQSEGEGEQQYFFLDTNNDSNSLIPYNLRRSLKPENLIIGIFLCKLVNDFTEIETISDFKKALREEYEPYKENFYRLLAFSKDSKQTIADDEAVDKQVERAFSEFNRLGWIQLDGGYFEVMPSLERLRLLYETEIYNVDDLITEEQANE